MRLKIKRLDHHGIVAGVIDDLNIVPLLDKHLPQDDKQEITPGEAIKGMIMNGLEFSNRPLSLSPQFFTSLPMEHLFLKGVEASHFNRHKLGRTLDQCADFGCESLFSLVSHQACELEAVDCTFKSLDTTSHSLTGEYADNSDEDCDEQVIHITHGYSKAHRPDLKQVVQEMIVSQDGGIPLACKNWDGNTADTKVFKERAKALVEMLKKSKQSSYLVADCKLYHKDNAEFLSQLTFITLIPSTIKLENTLITEVLAAQQWQQIDDNYQYSVKHVEHMGITQRWMVVHSKAAGERGFRFLKDPLFFVSSLFIKKPSRIDALLMIMTLSLLVYSIAQRRMRQTMKQSNETIPSQINQPNGAPTLRWVFQCFEGINLVQSSEIDDKTDIYLDGFDHLRAKIIRMIGGNAMHLYNIQKSDLVV